MHRYHIIDDFLEKQNIGCMNWTSRSLDISPIEHFWNGLGKTTVQRNFPSQDPTEIKSCTFERIALLPFFRFLFVITRFLIRN